jgi:hypothetical protein
MKWLLVTAAAICAIPATGFAQAPLGTADEAKAMLVKVIAAVKADRDVALAMFNMGQGGFKDRDLYPFCYRVSDGKGLAVPFVVEAGTDVRTLKDANGVQFGLDGYNTAVRNPEGQITATPTEYLFPKPGTTAPAVPKRSFVTQVSGLVCGVGYYK